MTINQPLANGLVLNNRYKIERVLGAGGMGKIYLSTDIQLGTKVIVKENLESAPELFEKEARVLATLKHKNLPTMYAYFIENGRQFLVMEYIEGEDLQGKIFEWKDCLEIVEQIISALEYTHNLSMPVIHRDIKPANIVIKNDGTVYLVDFGIMKVGLAGTQTGARAVTPGFSPPEQYMGDGSTDQRSDQYALAATVFTLLTGLVPPVRDLQGVSPIPRISDLEPSIPQYVSTAIERGMSYFQNDRFPSITAFWRALNGQSNSALCITLDNARKLKPIKRFGRGTIHQAAWSPDESLIAVSARDGVWIYKTSTLDLHGTIHQDKAVVHVDFSPDGDYLVTADGDHVMVWNANTLALTESTEKNPNHEFYHYSYASYINSSSLFFYSHTLSIVPFGSNQRFAQGKSYEGFSYSKPKRVISTSAGIIYSSREKFRLFGDSTQVEAFNSKLKKIKTINLNGKDASLTLSANGEVAAVLMEKGQLYISSTHGSYPPKKIPMNKGIIQIGLSPDGKSLVLTYPDRLVFYDWNKSLVKGEVLGDFSSVTFLLYSPRGGRLLVVHQNHKLQIFSITMTHPLISETVPAAWKDQERIKIGFSADNSLLLAESKDYRLVWKVKDWSYVTEPAGTQWFLNETRDMTSQCGSYKFELDTQFLTVRDLKSDAIVQHQIYDKPIAIAVSPDRSMVATVTSDGRIKIWTVN